MIDNKIKFVLVFFLFIPAAINAQPVNTAFKRFEGHSTVLSLLNYSNTEDSLQTGGLDESKPLKWYDMFTNIPGDYLTFYHQSFSKENIPLIVGLTALTAGLIVSDDMTYQYQHGKIYSSNNFNRIGSDIFTELGDGRTQFSLAAAFAAYGFISNDSRALRTASQIVEAVLAAGTVVQVLKHTTGRESPIASTAPNGAWRFFPSIFDYHKKIPAFDAYPSGHVATSLAAFTVIAENYPEYKWIKPVSYSIVALIGFSMVNRGEHWYSDYPLGIALGYSFGKFIANPVNKSLKSSKSEVSYNLFPYMSSTSSGFALAVSF